MQKNNKQRDLNLKSTHLFTQIQIHSHEFEKDDEKVHKQQ